MLDAVCAPRFSPKNHGVKSATLINVAEAKMKKVFRIDAPVSPKPSGKWLSRQQESLADITVRAAKITVAVQYDCLHRHVGEEHATKKKTGLGPREHLCAEMPEKSWWNCVVSSLMGGRQQRWLISRRAPTKALATLPGSRKPSALEPLYKSAAAMNHSFN